MRDPFPGLGALSGPLFQKLPSPKRAPPGWSPRLSTQSASNGRMTWGSRLSPLAPRGAAARTVGLPWGLCWACTVADSSHLTLLLSPVTQGGSPGPATPHSQTSSIDSPPYALRTRQPGCRPRPDSLLSTGQRRQDCIEKNGNSLRAF